MGLLRAMQNLKVTPDFETLRHYVLPRLDMTDPIVVVRKLQDLRLPVAEALQPIVCFLLNRSRIKDCVALGNPFIDIVMILSYSFGKYCLHISS